MMTKNQFTHFISYLFHYCCSLLARGIFLIFCRVHVVILEAPPIKSSFIMASNHISHFDPPLLSAFFPRQLDWVAMEELFSHPWAARFFSWLGVIAIDRFGKKSNSNRYALKKMQASLDAGRVLGMFPEGGIRSGKASILESAPMKPGLATLSIMTQSPVIPCVVLGSDRLYTKQAWFHRTPLWIIIGKAIHPPVATTMDRNKNLLLLQKQLNTTFPALQQELRERFGLSEDDLPKTAQARITEVQRNKNRLLAEARTQKTNNQGPLE
jgi:1-acyl-sn-glycerol-3-phosphate acyltransferase